MKPTSRVTMMASTYYRNDGLTLIEAPWMTIAGEPQAVPRTWRERLFTRPWQPFRKTKTVIPRIPDTTLVNIGHTIYGHPETLKQVIRAFREETV